jgi:hypothetical protein
MISGLAATTIDAVARAGEDMTGVATGVRRQAVVRIAPEQRRVAEVRPVVHIEEKRTVQPRVSELQSALRLAVAVRGWAAVIAASAALVAVLLQLYLSDSTDADFLVPEWVPSVAVLIGLLAALAVRTAGRVLPRRFILGFGWLSAVLLAWTAGCLVPDVLRMAHAAPHWNGMVAHGLALVAAVLLAVRTYRFQQATRRR